MWSGVLLPAVPAVPAVPAAPAPCVPAEPSPARAAWRSQRPLSGSVLTASCLPAVLAPHVCLNCYPLWWIAGIFYSLHDYLQWLMQRCRTIGNLLVKAGHWAEQQGGPQWWLAAGIQIP